SAPCIPRSRAPWPRWTRRRPPPCGGRGAPTRASRRGATSSRWRRRTRRTRFSPRSPSPWRTPGRGPSRRWTTPSSRVTRAAGATATSSARGPAPTRSPPRSSPSWARTTSPRSAAWSPASTRSAPSSPSRPERRGASWWWTSWASRSSGTRCAAWWRPRAARRRARSRPAPSPTRCAPRSPPTWAPRPPRGSCWWTSNTRASRGRPRPSASSRACAPAWRRSSRPLRSPARCWRATREDRPRERHPRQRAPGARRGRVLPRAAGGPRAAPGRRVRARDAGAPGRAPRAGGARQQRPWARAPRLVAVHAGGRRGVRRPRPRPRPAARRHRPRRRGAPRAHAQAPLRDHRWDARGEPRRAAPRAGEERRPAGASCAARRLLRRGRGGRAIHGGKPLGPRRDARPDDATGEPQREPLLRLRPAARARPAPALRPRGRLRRGGARAARGRGGLAGPLPHGPPLHAPLRGVLLGRAGAWREGHDLLRARRVRAGAPPPGGPRDARHRAHRRHRPVHHRSAHREPRRQAPGHAAHHVAPREPLAHREGRDQAPGVPPRRDGPVADASLLGSGTFSRRRPYRRAMDPAQVAEKLIPQLEARHFSAEYAPDRAAAKESFLKRIPRGAAVMAGSSTTLDQIGVTDALKSGEWDYLRAKVWAEQDPAKRQELRMRAMLAPFFLGSVGAITEEGVLVASDFGGSRVAGYVAGPERV